MQLTQYTDYSLRVLIYLGVNEQHLATISEISESYGISRNHLVKIVHQLGQHGYIETRRGKGGGIQLSRSPAEINIGEVIRRSEGNFNIVECFNEGKQACSIVPGCRLKTVIAEAMDSFFSVLDHYTLNDLIANKRSLKSLLHIPL